MFEFYHEMYKQVTWRVDGAGVPVCYGGRPIRQKEGDRDRREVMRGILDGVELLLFDDIGPQYGAAAGTR